MTPSEKNELYKLRIIRDEYIKDMNALNERIVDLQVEKFRRFNDDECWVYQEDGENYLESLVCPVVISARKLIELGG